MDLYSVFGISCNDKHEGEISNVADVEYRSCVKQTKAITSHSCFSSLKVNVLCDLHRGIKFSYSSRCVCVDTRHGASERIASKNILVENVKR